MSIPPRTFRLLASAIALPLLAAPFSASGAADQGGDAVAPKPVEANDGIIDLPLQPVVPASQRSCTERTASGLGYTMLRPASGPKPASDDTVLINYIGYLTSTGAVFDQNMQSPLPVGGVIPGFSQGLQLIAKTGVIRLCIPAAMGYGVQAMGPIPANSDLVFQVELLDFKTPAELEEMRKAQAAEGPSSPDQ